MPQKPTPWKLLSSTKALDEKWFPVRKDRVQLPSGRIVDDFFVWESVHIVTVVALTADNQFVLVRQYRHAINAVVHQFPAGAVDADESLEAAARRELREESGYICNKPLIHLGTMAPYGTKVTGVEDIFLAPGVTKAGEPREDDMEESEVVLKTREELMAMFDTGGLQMANLMCGTFLALRYLDTH